MIRVITAVKARHYARWTDGDEYPKLLELAAGEVPADLLERIESPRIPPTAKTGGIEGES